MPDVHLNCKSTVLQLIKPEVHITNNSAGADACNKSIVATSKLQYWTWTNIIPSHNIAKHGETTKTWLPLASLLCCLMHLRTTGKRWQQIKSIEDIIGNTHYFHLLTILPHFVCCTPFLRHNAQFNAFHHQMWRTHNSWPKSSGQSIVDSSSHYMGII